jgi:hypothetical protein
MAERSYNGIAGSSNRLDKAVRKALREIDPDQNYSEQEVHAATRLYLTIWGLEADLAEEVEA